jgi:hypothetical protein
LFLPGDDATVVGHGFGSASGMPDMPPANRVTVLETKMKKVDSFIENFDKVLQVRFREQAEMLDERFAQVNTDMNRGFSALQKDITIIREGMKILLERVR